ncbi:LysR family transcriptional regulator [Aliiruegeria sabulilitoris]|uniref:LysR family transcriptional regulator n=1 Tax=Aliiruegeria sabulilitoris TaxID=1510458 RepID=UPI000829A738|nr:LysR family transcriptional regulator [Aliiruegeria sabulilitoris]NDR58718.1 LysR family transcriptional regulator [Pseudoruegeria sp. M32A2M]
MDKWGEIRTAYHVAKLGTVSAAAETLGVHRATVNRHIDALEAHLGAKLFQRHGRGYVLTETGRELLTVMGRADEMVADFTGRTRARDAELTGEIIITTVPPLAGRLMAPIIRFREQNPKTRVTLLAEEELLKLEYGEAHIALRGGPRPDQDDYVIQDFDRVGFGLYAHERYVRRRGLPRDAEDLATHDFIGIPNRRGDSVVEAWLSRIAPEERVVLRTSDVRTTQDAVLSGAAIGFLPAHLARQYPGLHQVLPPRPEWFIQLWLVTHVDLHRTDKVQAMLKCIKDAPPTGSGLA